MPPGKTYHNPQAVAASCGKIHLAESHARRRSLRLPLASTLALLARPAPKPAAPARSACRAAAAAAIIPHVPILRRVRGRCRGFPASGDEEAVRTDF
jgi:hypothetical protein